MRQPFPVMPGLDPGIHAVTFQRAEAQVGMIAGAGNDERRKWCQANVTLITLTVADIAKATRFYESLGFVKSKSESQEQVSFFRAGGIVLSLWDRKEQIQDANAGTLWDGNGGIVVAQNVASEAEVDAILSESESQPERAS